MNAPSAYAIERVVSVWMAARTRLLETDTDTLADENAILRLLGPADGEVREILTRLLRAARHAQAMEEAADRQLDELTERRNRYRKRYEDARDDALQIMEIIGERRFELPDMLASVATSQPSVVITDEAKLADEYWRVTRAPDKRAIGDDLKQGVVIDGAMLGNPKQSLRIKTR
jgi:hypothetical protein